MNWLQRILRGRDVFVSYARSDGRLYATRLASVLSDAGLTCFLDQYVGVPDRKIPQPVRDELHRASMLVLVATPQALASPAVKEEVDLFTKAGKAILPITFDTGDVAALDALGVLLPGLTPAREDAGALGTGAVASSVVTEIQAAASFRRQTQRLARMVTAATVMLAGLLAAIGVVGWLVREATVDLEATRARLTNVRAVYDAQQKSDPVDQSAGFAQVKPDVEPSPNEHQAAISLAQALVPVEFNDDTDHTFVRWTDDGESFITRTDRHVIAWTLQGRRLLSTRWAVDSAEARRLLGSALAEEPASKVAPGRHVYSDRVSPAVKPDVFWTGGPLLSLPFEPWHRLVAYASDDERSPIVWSSRFGPLPLPHAAPVTLVKVHPFLDIVATETKTASGERHLLLWSLGSQGARQQADHLLTGDIDLGEPAFSPDGSRLLLTSLKSTALVDLGDPSQLRPLKELPGGAQSYSYSEGNSIVSIGHDHVVRVIDGTFLRFEARHPQNVDRAIYRRAAAGERGILYTTSWDKRLRLWYSGDRVRGPEEFVTELVNPDYRGMQVSRSGQTVFMPEYGKGFRLWLLQPAEPWFDAGHHEQAAAFSPDGQWLVVEGSEVLRSMRSGGTDRSPPGLQDTRQARFTDDAGLLFGLADQGKTVRIWRGPAFDRAEDVAVQSQARHVFHDPLTQQLVAISDNSVRLVSTAAPASVAATPLPEGVRWVSWDQAPNRARSTARLQVFSSSGNELNQWWLWDPRQPQAFKAHTHARSIRAFAISDDAKKVALFDEDGVIMLHDITSGQASKLTQLEKSVLDQLTLGIELRFSPSGNFLLVESSTRGVLVSVREPGRIWRAGGGSAVSHDDRWLAYFDKGVTLTRLDEIATTLRLDDKTEVGELHFTPADDRLLVVQRMRGARLMRYRWGDLVTGIQARHAATVYSAASAASQSGR